MTEQAVCAGAAFTRQTAQTISGVLYAESADGISWRKPPLALIPYGDLNPDDACYRNQSRGPCLPADGPLPPATVGRLGGEDVFIAGR